MTKEQRDMVQLFLPWAQGYRDQAAQLLKDADRAEFQEGFPSLANSLRGAASSLHDSAETIRTWLRKELGR